MEENKKKYKKKNWLFQPNLIKKLWICLSSILLWGWLGYCVWVAFLFGGGRALVMNFDIFNEMRIELFYVPFMCVISIICSYFILKDN